MWNIFFNAYFFYLKWCPWQKQRLEVNFHPDNPLESALQDIHDELPVKCKILVRLYMIL